MKRTSSFGAMLQSAAILTLGAGPLLLLSSIATPGAVGASSGEQIFKANCAACHAAGGNIVDPKKPLKGSSQLASEDKFKAYLLKPSGVMQPFPKIANNKADLEALYTYCKSLK